MKVQISEESKEELSISPRRPTKIKEKNQKSPKKKKKKKKRKKGNSKSAMKSSFQINKDWMKNLKFQKDD